METFLVDTGALLVAEVDALTLGSTLFLGQFPAELDLTVPHAALFESAGPAPDNANRLGFPRLQVCARCSSYAVARALAFAVYRVLNDLAPRTIGSTSILYCTALQAPFPIGKDERQAWRYVCNYEFTIEGG